MRSNPIYIIICLWFVLGGLFAQTVPSTENTSVPAIDSLDNSSKESVKESLKQIYDNTTLDTVKTYVIPLDTSLRKKYLADEDFNYQNTRKESSALKKFLNNLSRIFEKLFALESNSHIANFNQIFIKFIFGAILLVALYFVIKYVLKHKGGLLFAKKDQPLAIDIENTEQLIQSGNFPLLIDENEQRGDRRQCIRLYYLWLLKLLKEQEVIEWLPEKTNSDYLVEIKNELLKAKFGHLSYIYNYIWYGEFPVTEYEYSHAKTEFLSFIKKETLNE